MNDVLYSFILTTLAGLSTTLGFFIIFVKGDTNKIISFFLSFASGVMFIISLIDLIPSAFNYFSDYYLLFRLLLMAFFIVLGVFLSTFVNHYISKYENNDLKKLGVLSLISIVLHNIPEGIITFMASQYDIEIGLSLAIAISLHNIPEGISIAIPLYYATKKRLKVFMVVLIAGLSELVGGVITYLFLGSIINAKTFGMMYAIIAGIMLNISLTSLLPEAYSLRRKIAVIGFIIGILVMYISDYLI